MHAELKVDELTDYVDNSRSSYEKRLKEMVDIPGVSMQPEHKEDIYATARYACALLETMGAKAEIIETEGYPVVTGCFQSAAPESVPTVLVYNHLDVQPADPMEWKNPPFEMSTDGDKYLGRGTTDDKGPALAVLYAAKYAHDHGFPLNIKFVWELEEEIGSPSFEKFLLANKNLLDADSVVISDTVWISRDIPAVPYGLRGLQAFLVKLQTGEKDVHSGEVGGLARNPLTEICRLIASCVDANTGEVKIPGFYDQVRKEDDQELNDMVEAGFTLEHFQEAHELHSLRTNDAKEGAARIWTRPTFEVHGITGGYSGPGVKTIVPYYAEAKVSMRLVPDQDPEHISQLFADFVAKECPDARVERKGALKPYLGERSGQYSSAAESAYQRAFGKKVCFTREGGSIGAVVSMKEVLGAPVVFLGLSLPEHGYHAVNENFDWGQASKGMHLFVHYFKILSEMQRFPA